MTCKNIQCPTADNIAKLKRLSSPNRLSRVCRFRRQAERGLPRPRTLPVGIPFESRVLPTRLYFFPYAPARNRFALRQRSLPPIAFASAEAFVPAATWTRLCSRSSRIGGWLHSRYGNVRILVPKGEGDSAVVLGISHLSFGRTFWEAVVRSFSVGCSERPLHDSYSYAMTCIAAPSLCVGRPLRDSCSYAMVLGDLRCCKTAFYRTGRRATIYGAGAVMRRCAPALGDLRRCKTPLIACAGAIFAR